MGVLELKTKVFSKVSLRWQQHSGFKGKDTEAEKIREENLEQTLWEQGSWKRIGQEDLYFPEI